MSGALTLATLVAGMTRDQLTDLTRSRRITAPDLINDPVDVAQALLRTDSLQEVLRLVNREAVCALLQCDSATPEAREQLAALGLLGRSAEGELVPLDEVTSACAALARSHGWSPEQCSAPLRVAPRDTAPPLDDWFAAALTSVGQLAALVRALSVTPMRLNRTGKPQTAAVRTCAARIGVTEERAFDLLDLGRASRRGDTANAGDVVAGDTALLAPGPDQLLHPGRGAAAWLARDPRDRWITVASLADAAPPALMESLDRVGGFDVSAAVAALPQVIPFVSEAVLTECARVARVWETLGVTVSGWLSAPGAALVAGDVATAATAEFPDPAPGVYLQPDLTVIVPGPLSAKDDAVLAACTVPEQIGVASTLRVTEASLLQAFEQGLSEADLRELFSRLSLTGLPQPLDYLITTVAEQVRSILVLTHDGDEGRSRIEVRKRGLAEMLRVDRALEHLHLQPASSRQSVAPPLQPEISRAVAPAGDTRDSEALGTETLSVTPQVLYSRLRPEHVLLALTEARYAALSGDDLELWRPGAAALAQPATSAPAEATTAEATTAEATTGATEPAGTPSLDETATAAAATIAADPLDELVERVLAAGAQGDGLGDVAGQIALACKEKIALEVRVEMRGHTRDFVLTPLSLSAGRVRGLDEQAGVERTLPIDAITAIRPAPPQQADGHSS